VVWTNPRDSSEILLASTIMLGLSPRPSSCVTARHAIRTFCDDHQIGTVADHAELLVSELVTNAIENCRSKITLLAICQAGELTISIRDDGCALPPRIMTADPEAESGRGLYLVDKIAGAWGTLNHADGKSVWFRLASGSGR